MSRPGVTMGCEYRARTGACGCPNPPYGCRTGGDGFKISFPKGVDSYRELRTGGGAPAPASGRATGYGGTSETQYNEHGIPVGFSMSDSKKKGASGPTAPAAPLRPPPLPLDFAIPGWDKRLPAVGWQCTAADAAAAVTAGVRYVDAAGDAAAETAIGAALSTLDPSTRATMVVATAVSAGAPGGLKAAAAAAAARLGVSCVDVLLLQWDSPADDSLAAAWAEMGALQAAGTATLVGLRCEDVLTAKAAFEHVSGNGGAAVAVLATVVHPLVAKVQRLLLGACKRARCQMVCLQPLGGARAAELKALPDVTASTAPPNETLLSYSVGRAVVALPCAAEGAAAADATMHLRPMMPEQRTALVNLAPQA